MELWDAYDRDMNLIHDMILERGPVPKGIYHIVCEIAVLHTDGTYLIMQRDFKKHLGGMWELTAGGSALKGETPLECAFRELREETGVVADSLKQIGRVIHDEHNSIYFEYLCVTNCDKDSITLQEGETVNYKWVSADEFKAIPKEELATTRIQMYIDELRLMTVTVKIDRPLGTYHPKHSDLYYPVNYGYIEGIIAGDGEEQDAYLLGVDTPVNEFTGDLIAIIHRLDDVEDKWVVAPKGTKLSADEIKKRTNFQEQYFNTEIEIC